MPRPSGKSGVRCHPADCSREIGTGSLSIALAGPGIEERLELCLSGLHPDWLARREDWVGAFPLGVDILFCDAQRIVALPRTTHAAITAGVV
ncbi:MAG: phosphonate C-P lyase system protein PhnH [Propionivibrio sp.]|nr:phosphonate C-P lyase system protein PhnH [Propionivibrio sp.]